MNGVVGPVAESILPKATLSWQSGGPVTADGACTADATRSTWTAGTAHTTGPTRTTYAADTTDAAGLAHSADTAGPAWSTNATDTTYTADSAYATDTADTTYTADTANATYSTDASWPTHTSDAAGGAIEVVVVIDIDISTAPAATPAPTAAPPGSHHDSGAECECGSCRVVTGRIVDGRVWILRRTVCSYRLVRRHVHDFWIGGLNNNHAPVINYAGFHFLLFGRVQNTLALRLLTHALNGIHQLALLRQEGVTEIGSPLNVVAQ